VNCILSCIGFYAWWNCDFERCWVICMLRCISFHTRIYIFFCCSYACVHKFVCNTLSLTQLWALFIYIVGTLRYTLLKLFLCTLLHISIHYYYTILYIVGAVFMRWVGAVFMHSFLTYYALFGNH
jgi:hypothetical protein